MVGWENDLRSGVKRGWEFGMGHMIRCAGGFWKSGEATRAGKICASTSRGMGSGTDNFM